MLSISPPPTREFPRRREIKGIALERHTFGQGNRPSLSSAARNQAHVDIDRYCGAFVYFHDPVSGVSWPPGKMAGRVRYWIW